MAPAGAIAGHMSIGHETTDDGSTIQRNGHAEHIYNTWLVPFKFQRHKIIIESRIR